MTQMYQRNVTDTAFAVFFEEAIENKRESKKQGHPVFDNVVMVEILTPGSKDVYRGPAEPSHKERFAKQWEQFQNKQKQTPSGTPIDELSTVTAVQRATCKALNVLTIEGLANYPDSAIHKLGPGGFALKRTAAAFLESRKGASYANALQAENEELRSKIADLETKLQKVLERLSERTQESGK